MKQLFSRIRTYPLLSLGIGIHALFYISVLGPGWLNIFFSDPQVHYHDQGVDFLQVVRGAWAWWHGGSLTGASVHGTMYAPVHYFVNSNEYHPLFTLLVGSVLMLLSPGVSYAAWIVIKLCIDVCVLWYFWREFRHEKHIQLAMFLMLANASVSLELAAGQYHFLLNMAILLMLIALHKNQRIGATVAYAVSLLIKPMGLLFVPALALKRHWRMAFVALDVLIAATVPFVLNGSGVYYVSNLWANIVHPVLVGSSQILTLNALLRRSTNWPAWIYQSIQYGCLALVALLPASKRVHLNKAIFFAVVYFLLFYNLIYEYDYSMLGYVGAVCLLTLPEFQTRLSRVCLVLVCLPTCFVVLRALHVDVIQSAVYGTYPNVVGWQIVVMSKLVPVLALCVSVMAGDVRFWTKWVRVMGMRKPGGRQTTDV